MAILSSVHLEIHGLLASQTTFTKLIWFAESENPSINGSDVTQAFVDDIQSSLLTQLCDDFILLELQGWYSDFTIGKKPTYTQIVNGLGAVSSSEPMPPFCTINIMKNPDNTTKFPSGNPNFRQGFVGFSGFPEDQQNNGLLTSTAESAWNAIGELLETLDVNAGGSDVEYTLGMYRDSEVVAERTYVYVEETYANQKVGTRNSRKR